MLAAMPRFVRWLWLAALVLGGGLAGFAAPWADVPSDRLPEPTLRTGTLPNGLRWVILPNVEPKGRVSLRLLVAAGSLVEHDEERGLAHFIEHMAFRGSRAFPGNQLTTTLERAGIGLGPDNTAFTSYDYTVYHLELPDTQAATLRLGLTVFREYADGLTFDPAAIEKERGVVLSEKETRNTPEERINLANLMSIWPDSRYCLRNPIGVEATVGHFTREQFVAFYDAWYRPERLAVIIVGDVEPAAVEPLLTEVLGPLQARAPALPEPTDIVPEKAAPPNVEVYREANFAGVRFYFTHPHRQPRPPDTHEQRVAAVHRALAFAMFNKRLDWDVQRRGGSFVAPTVQTDTYVAGWEAVSFSASGRISDWPRLAAELEQEHRRAYLLGFTEDELSLAKASLLNSYEQATRTAPTRRSEAMAALVAGSLLYGGVLVAPADVQRELAPVVEATTVAECTAAFREAWTSAPPHVLVTAHSSFPSSATVVGGILNASRALPVKLRVPPGDVKFAYHYFGATGQIEKDRYEKDLDVHLARFANGVRLNFKPTTFEADTVSITVRVGTGKLTQPRDQPGLDYLAAYGFVRGGVVLHSNEELDALLSRHVLSVGFGIEPDACAFYVRCARRDLLLALQVVAAYLTDPAFRPSAMEESRASFGTLYNTFDTMPGGPISLHAERILANASRLIGPPEPDEAYARTFRELSLWLRPQFASGPIEMSIVGDATWAEASDATARTLGALGRREDPSRQSREARFSFAAPYRFPQMYPLNPTLRQTALAWYWPVPDLADVQQERRCRMLASVLAERLFVRLREELGATYTPAADFVQYDGWPSFSYFYLRADVPPAQGVKAAQVIRHEIARLVEHGIDPDLFVRVREPFLRDREKDLRNNGYWCHTVLRDAQLRPERLQAARNRTEDSAAIRREELEALARRYLKPGSEFRFVAEPGPTDSWAAKYMWDPQ